MCFDRLVINCVLVALLVRLANFVGLEPGAVVFNRKRGEIKTRPLPYLRVRVNLVTTLITGLVGVEGEQGFLPSS
jgi:hypothetical protein